MKAMLDARKAGKLRPVFTGPKAPEIHLEDAAEWR